MSKLVPFRSVLIFGGAGFIGSNWAHFLLKNSDARIHIFDREGNALRTLQGHIMGVWAMVPWEDQLRRLAVS